MDGLLKEVRYAWRGLRHNPSISVIAVVALGLGIGLTTVMFSIVYGALHRGLPFDGAERIMHLERANPEAGFESMEVTIHDFRDWEERQRSFETFGAFYTGTVNVRGSERPERFAGAFMTASVFDVVGTQPILGRTFTREEERPGGPQVVLLGYRVWQDRFGGSRDVLGQTVTVNGEVGEIIGVMPEGFEFPILQEVWAPLRLDEVALDRGTGMTLEVVGKLASGIDLDAAAVEMAGITAQLAEEYPATNEGITALIKPYTEEFIGEEESNLLYAMLATVILVLIIACANVANLLLARASMRTRDLAIRTAMGAERWRVIAQLLAEALVLALVGALLGVGIAWIGIGAFDRAVAPTDPPFWLVFSLDAPILLFVLAIAAVAALAAGVIPAIKASGTDVNSVLKDDSRGSSSMQIGRLSRVLVMAEVALSMALLVASGLMVKGVVKLNNEDYGIPMEDVFTARIGTFEERFPDADSRRMFWDDVERRMREIPGVRGVALSNALPGEGSWGSGLRIDGDGLAEDDQLPFVNYLISTPGFAETFDVEVLQGRWIEEGDLADAPAVVVVNERFVEEHFPDGQALGRLVKVGNVSEEGAWREVVGVVPNYRIEGIGNVDPGGVVNRAGAYIPLAQQDLRFLSVSARVDGAAPLSISASVRDAVASADPDTPIYFVQSLQQAIDQQIWFYRIFGNLFLAFGVAALFLASVGLYGVMSFGVNQRTGEMGIRMALGAEGRQVLGMILRQGLVQILVGVVLGSGLAYLVARGLRLVLYQVEPFDPVTFAGVFLLLAATGVAASFVPALRATRVDPMIALRRE